MAHPACWRVTALLAFLVAAPAAFAQDGGAAGVAGCYELAVLSDTEVPAHLRWERPLPRHVGLSPLPSRHQMASPGSRHVAYPEGYPYRPFLSWRLLDGGDVWVGREASMGGISLWMAPAGEGVFEGTIEYTTDALALDPNRFAQAARLVPAAPERCDAE